VRVRLRFAKLGKVRWTSALDLARIWERALRRARVPVARTQGFSPRPRVSFGLALPTGAESVAEYLDLQLERELDPSRLPEELSSCLPQGIDVLAAVELGPGDGSLQEEVTSCEWQLELAGPGAGALGDRVGEALGANSLPVVRQRKGRQVADDLRPAILALEALAGPGPTGRLRAAVATQPRGLRPSELVAVLGDGLELVGALRTSQWIERHGARREPIPLAGHGAPHALERAS
jgi:radical SAM-linked protein